MEKLFFALALIPKLSLAGSILLTVSAPQGLSKLKLPGEVVFESTNAFCEERGILPQPWSAPRKEKLTPKVVSIEDKTVVLEISTESKKRDICRYRFAEFTVWSEDQSFFVTVEGSYEDLGSVIDGRDLELVNSQNSLYTVECLRGKNHRRSCGVRKDGAKKGYASGNGGRLYVDMKKLEEMKEIRAQIEYRESTK